jgi:hypothetical protein
MTAPLSESTVRDPEVGSLEWLEALPSDQRLGIATVWARYAEKSVGYHGDEGTMTHLKWAVGEVARLRAEINRLLAERHATNEALDDAVAALRARDGRFHPEGRAA